MLIYIFYLFICLFIDLVMFFIFIYIHIYICVYIYIYDLADLVICLLVKLDRDDRYKPGMTQVRFMLDRYESKFLGNLSH